MEGVNSVVYKARLVFVEVSETSSSSSSDADSVAFVERDGPLVVVKCLITPSQASAEERRSKAYSSMLERQAADYEVLCGLPAHPNIVEVVHQFVGPALLARPFVPVPLLPYFSITKTT